MDLQQTEHQDCIDQCWTCSHECKKTLFNYCLAMGGAHAQQEHVRLMSDCLQICQVAADFMVRGSAMHAAICNACAEICDNCAESCEAIGDDMMKHCADTCRECAEICRKTAGIARQATSTSATTGAGAGFTRSSMT